MQVVRENTLAVMGAKKSLEKTLIMAENKEKKRGTVQERERERRSGLLPKITPFIGTTMMTLNSPK